MNLLKDLQNTTNEYLKNNISTISYIDILKNILKETREVPSIEDIKTITCSHKSSRTEKEMLALVILWILPNTLIKKKDLNMIQKDMDSDNKFLYEVLEEYPALCKDNFEYLFLDNKLLIIKKENLLILINPSNIERELAIPESIQKEQIFCVNCNDYINFNSTIWLNSYGFYILDNE